MALASAGVVRATADVDVNVFIAENAHETLLDALVDCGASLDRPHGGSVHRSNGGRRSGSHPILPRTQGSTEPPADARPWKDASRDESCRLVDRENRACLSPAEPQRVVLPRHQEPPWHINAPPSPRAGPRSSCHRAGCRSRAHVGQGPPEAASQIRRRCAKCGWASPPAQEDPAGAPAPPGRCSARPTGAGRILLGPLTANIASGSHSSGPASGSKPCVGYYTFLDENELQSVETSDKGCITPGLPLALPYPCLPLMKRDPGTPVIKDDGQRQDGAGVRAAPEGSPWWLHRSAPARPGSARRPASIHR